MHWLPGIVLGLGGLLCLPPAAAADRLESLGDPQLDPDARVQLAQQLQQNPETQLLDVLQAMRGQSAIAQNWYLAVAQSVADRDREQARLVLEQFLPRLSENPAARYWAFTFLTRDDPQQREEQLQGMLADPSLELRFEAVELRIKRLAAKTDLPEAEQIAAYQELLAAARLPSQIQDIAKKLQELNQPVDLRQHFGFVSQWQLVGPFANLNQSAFDEVYGPEADYLAGRLDLSGNYPGKSKTVSWQEATTQAADGAVNLNEIFDNAKGAIVYGLAQFETDQEVSCEVRIGSPNACKVWVNGKPVIAREVYHAGSQIDQYAAPIELTKGANSILVKICQNEQTDSWAQDWSFQLRCTDASGTPIRPQSAE